MTAGMWTYCVHPSKNTILKHSFKGVFMKKKLSNLSLLALSVSLLGQTPIVLANTETTTTVETTPSTTVADLTQATTTLEALTDTSTTTADTEVPMTSEPSTNQTPTTTVEETTAAEAVEESFRKVGGVIDTVALPDGRLVYKVRLDSLILQYGSSVKYKITNVKTGKQVDTGYLYFNRVEKSSLKNLSYWGKANFNNVVTGYISSYRFNEDPSGTYKILVEGNANYEYNKIFGRVKIEKEITLSNQNHTTTSFTKVGGKIVLEQDSDNNITYSVSLNHLIHRWDSSITYQLVHKKTGKVVDSGTLYCNEVDSSSLTNKANWGRSNFENKVTGVIQSYHLSDDPKGEYIFRVTGPANDDYRHIFGIVNLSKGINTPVKPTPTPKPVPASTIKPVYRLYNPGLQVHLYTKDTNEQKILQTRGWKLDGVAWKTEQSKGKPIYRLYHPGQKYHFYTTDANEYKVLGTLGWIQEGVSFKDYGTVAVYRLYSPGLRKHLFTRDINERNVLQTRGWNYEGVAWYSQP